MDELDERAIRNICRAEINKSLNQMSRDVNSGGRAKVGEPMYYVQEALNSMASAGEMDVDLDPGDCRRLLDEDCYWEQSKNEEGMVVCSRCGDTKNMNDI